MKDSLFIYLDNGSTLTISMTWKTTITVAVWKHRENETATFVISKKQVPTLDIVIRTVPIVCISYLTEVLRYCALIGTLIYAIPTYMYMYIASRERI